MPTASVTPTTPTFVTPIPIASYAASATPNSRYSLDLTSKFGATLNMYIGRNVATALTRSARICVRRTINGTSRVSSDAYDLISTTVACNATTVSSGGAANAATMVLASGTGYAADQWCCANLSGVRAEFFRISDLTTATVTNDHPSGFLISHNASDVVTNGADVTSIWVPGGDLWDIWFTNNSGQTLIAMCEAAVYASDTVT